MPTPRPRASPAVPRLADAAGVHYSALWLVAVLIALFCWTFGGMYAG